MELMLYNFPCFTKDINLVGYLTIDFRKLITTKFSACGEMTILLKNMHLVGP